MNTVITFAHHNGLDVAALMVVIGFLYSLRGGKRIGDGGETETRIGSKQGRKR